VLADVVTVTRDNLVDSVIRDGVYSYEAVFGRPREPADASGE
jgi:hypothetical protein